MLSYLSKSLIDLVITITAFLLAITVHEFSHAWAAYALGDDTAQRHGRLTLNPFSHIDPIGLLALLLVRIGWARPVPMNPRNFRYPKLYAVLTGLAGPASNFVLALFFLYGIKLVTPAYMAQQGPHYFLKFFNVAAFVNVMLAVFNLVPIPPLDGGHIISSFIPPQWYRQFQLFSFLILIVLLMTPTFQAFIMDAIINIYDTMGNFVGIKTAYSLV